MEDLLFLSDFKHNEMCYKNFSKNRECEISRKGVHWYSRVLSCEKTDVETIDITKKVVTVLFAKAPKNLLLNVLEL
jgi:hypothetical protein